MIIAFRDKLRLYETRHLLYWEQKGGESMATYTENYNFLLTEVEDAFDITDYNENFKTIDTLMAENETAVNEVNEKIGTPENGETIFSLLKTGGSIIKSIQHVVYSNEQNNSSGKVTFDTVDPSKTIIIFERLTDLSNYSASPISYSLEESSISITHNSYSANSLKFGFWIVEFN